MAAPGERTVIFWTIVVHVQDDKSHSIFVNFWLPFALEYIKAYIFHETIKYNIYDSIIEQTSGEQGGALFEYYFEHTSHASRQC